MKASVAKLLVFAFAAALLFAGGKSFGARMTSQAQAAAALPEIRGLAFIGFPLHPASKAGTSDKAADDRARHLPLVRIPMLGRVASLNVATAAGLAAYEVARRRRSPATEGV